MRPKEACVFSAFTFWVRTILDTFLSLSLQRFLPTTERNAGVPKCSDCVTGVVRPDVVFFGESLPQRFWDLSGRDFAECDLLLVTAVICLLSLPWKFLFVGCYKMACNLFPCKRISIVTFYFCILRYLGLLWQSPHLTHLWGNPDPVFRVSTSIRPARELQGALCHGF